MSSDSQLSKKLKRLAGQDLLSHAYLFFGPENTAKKEHVLLLIRSYEENDLWQDTLSLEGEGIIGIQEIRGIKKFLYQTPIRSKRRICVIENAERLTWQATPALLKIMEEPPETSLIIMTAREKNVLSPALLSRFIKMYVPPKYSTSVPCLAGRQARDSAPEGLAEELEQSMIRLYAKDKIRNAKKISFLLQKLEKSRLNLNPKLQKKAVEYMTQ